MSVAAAIDFTKIGRLGLHKQTLSALAAFRKRAADAQVQHANLKEAKVDVDFAHYRAVLKNQKIVEEGEKLLRSFKPVDYDVNAQLKAIAAFEGKAVSLLLYSERQAGARRGTAERVQRGMALI